jgi:S-adenosylmethionine:tRNA ribosyltransferase-isomerase
MLLSDFDYRLPDELIAQEPLADRAASRMLVLDRKTGAMHDLTFRDLPRWVGPGDCLVLNDSRVLPTRLFGYKEGYARQVEIFLVHPENEDRSEWTCLVRPGRHLHVGAKVTISSKLSVEILESGVRGERRVRLFCQDSIEEELEQYGHVPLPPYIHRGDRPEDHSRYQTVYARVPGSVAAPTAGLHFTPEVLARCEQAGAAVAMVTLHVGLGTFQPLQHEEIEANRLHVEWFEISPAAATAITAAKRRIAVGTTSVRTLESVVRGKGFVPQTGETDMFIYPGFEFKAVDALLTNFHLPKSSLLLLVSAFAGKDLIRKSYEHAVEQRYRFFSYGDCMLIL